MLLFILGNLCCRTINFNELANVAVVFLCTHEHKRSPEHQHNEIPYLHLTKCLPDSKLEQNPKKTEQNQVFRLEVTRMCRAP